MEHEKPCLYSIKFRKLNSYERTVLNAEQAITFGLNGEQTINKAFTYKPIMFFFSLFAQGDSGKKGRRGYNGLNGDKVKCDFEI